MSFAMTEMKQSRALVAQAIPVASEAGKLKSSTVKATWVVDTGSPPACGEAVVAFGAPDG